MNKAIRVLQVFHGMDCGGAENMIMNLYRNIDREKVQFDFLVHTTKKCFFDDEIKQLGGRIYGVPYFNIKNTIAYKKALNKFFSEHSEIKIVHGHLGSCAHIYLDIAKKHGCFAIAHSHNTLPTDKSIKNTLYRLFSFKTREVADYFFGCGQQAGIDRFGKELVNSRRFRVLNNAIDSKEYIFNEEIRTKLRNELGLADSFVMGNVGRFNYQKNHEFLVRVFNEVQKVEPDSKLLLVGDGELRSTIEKQLKEFAIYDKCIFTGVRKDVPDLLQAMDCFVFPSHYEGLGIVAIEAQASGLPTICSDVVPEETKVTDLIEYISLNESAEEWSKQILKYKNGINRRDTSAELMSSGYDIHATANWLEHYYLWISDKMGERR